MIVIGIGLGRESSKNDDSMKATKLTFLVFTLVLGIFFVIQAPNANAATITSVNPSAVLSGDLITISGNGFGSYESGTTYVCFSFCELTYNDGSQNTWSDSVIQVVVPTAFLGAISLHLNHPYTIITGPTLTARVPTITDVSPITMDEGGNITVTGTNFGKSGSVALLSDDCASYNAWAHIVSWTETKVIFTPGCRFTGRFRILNKGSSVDGPILYSPPLISGINEATIFSGSTITITGALWGDTTGKVMVDGVQAVISSWGKNSMKSVSSTIVATVPVLPFTQYQATRNIDIQIFAHNDNDNTDTIASNIITKTAYRLVSSDPYSMLQEYLGITGISDVWSAPVNKKVTVAVIDDGVYINHPDLHNNIWVNPKESIGNRKDDDKNGYVDDIYGWDFISNSGEMTTKGSHGTMVAGIIAATRDNNEGIAGINPNATIMPLIACDSSGCNMSNVSKAIYYAANNGADIINLSLGTFATTGYTTFLDDAVKYAHSKGVIVVAAAGNGDTEGGLGQDLNRIPQTPVCNDTGTNAVIGVSASTNDGYRPTWANYGSNCVDIYAPGVGIVSTAVPASSTIGGFYDVGGGTSFSAPIITGLVGLLKQQYPTMPQSEVVARLYRHNKNGIIDAIGFIQEAYIPPTSKVLGVSVTKPIMKSGKIVASGFSINVKGKNVIVKPFSKYSGKVSSKQITFGDTSLYVFVPQDPYAKGAVYVYDGNGKALQILKPFGKYITSGMNVSFGVDSDSNTAWLAIGEAKGSRVAVYQIASNGVWLKSNLSKVTTKKGVSITVKWLKVYANQLGLVTMVTGKPSTVKTWRLNATGTSFTADSSVKSNRYRFSGKDVLLR